MRQGNGYMRNFIGNRFQMDLKERFVPSKEFYQSYR